MNNYINVECHSENDKLKNEEWPHFFACRPEKGDMVKSTTGKNAIIHSITHMKKESGTPYIRIVLRDPSW